MSGQEILEGNKLIAEFMGYQILRKKYETQYVCSSNETAWTVDEGDIVCDSNGNEVDYETQEPYFELECLPFDTSWDWLMPVVEKIEIECRYDINIYGHYNWKNPFRCVIVDNRNNEVVHQSNNSKLQCVHSAVNEFIKWYNLQK